MKKTIMILLALIVGMSGARATTTVTAGPVTIPQGGTGTISVSLDNDKAYTAFSMKLTLPNGVTMQSVTKGSRLMESHSLSCKVETGMITCLSSANEAITGSSGEVFVINVAADGGLAVGTELTATLTEVNFSTTTGEETLANVSIDITIGAAPETRTVLNETSTTAPEASVGAVDVRVVRTLKAGEWNTICLPFAMTAAQVTTAFGNDVELADFTGYEADEDDGGNIVGLTVNFSDVSAIEANHPYIIKVSANITEFTANGVTIDPEEEPTVATVKRTRRQWSEFKGTYVAQTVVPELCLFLNGNNFYYSTGATQMKGFRGYFDFYDVLTDVDNTYGSAGVKMAVFVNDVPTDIGAMNEETGSGSVYNLGGQRLQRPTRGVNIMKGKKVLVK